MLAEFFRCNAQNIGFLEKGLGNVELRVRKPVAVVACTAVLCESVKIGNCLLKLSETTVCFATVEDNLIQ
jgi:hypothetical protein